MDVRVQGVVPPDPFLSAADLFETEFDLNRPVRVRVRADPDERTWAAHYPDYHVLNISRQAATSAMARELAVHEFAHMARNEESHPSHTQSTEEALFLALSGKSVERRKLAHCYQIANHMKDIYADDLTLSVTPPDKLLGFLESRLATALADRPDPELSTAPTRDSGHRSRTGGDTSTQSRSRSSAGSRPDPEITAVNAAFALALVERHGLEDRDHRIHDLVRVAARDAPDVDVAAFTRRFRALAPGPSQSDYRKDLVDATRAYAASGA